MSAAIAKRKRARKACIPCHQRKRKCDAKDPCSMCIAYEYSCSYTNSNETNTASATFSLPTGRCVGGELQNGPSDGDDLTEHSFRYAGASAAMAYPHILSMALDSDNNSNTASKMHSFAYNFGIRPDEAAGVHGLLESLISEIDLTHYSGIYFSAMSSIGDLIDPKIYARRCKSLYQISSNASSTTLAFGAVAAGIAALGSFLSPQRHARESDLVRYAKAVLDDPASMHRVGVDHIIAWGMRVLYLRATTRPNNAWIASCTTMHLCEAIGLHDEDNIKKMASVTGAATLGHDTDRLRRIFWISWAGHTMLSYEYDRSSVHFRSVTTQAVTPTAGSLAHQFVQITQIIPVPNSPFCLPPKPRTQTEELFERLKVLQGIQVTDPFLLVTKADLAFCFYRRAYQLKMGIPEEFNKLVIDSGKTATAAAEQLARQGRFFWNVIGSVFHYACILIAIDTATASGHLQTAFKGLETLVVAADTSHTREALFTAQYLLSLYLSKKRKDVTQLEHVQASSPAFQTQLEYEIPSYVPDFGSGTEWDQFLLEPYISMFGSDIQM